MDIKAALKGQYHAALAMLKQAIEECPDSLWTGGEHPSEFWQVAYHAVFYTHLYLMPDEKAFRPWAHSRDEYNFLEALPWPPHDPPKLGEPYTKEEVLEYWAECDAMIDPGVDRLDLDAAECGFPWYDMPKLDHQLMNVRHIEHHTGQLADRMRPAGGDGVGWVGRKT